jgi:hypothetical protein
MFLLNICIFWDVMLCLGNWYKVLFSRRSKFFVRFSLYVNMFHLVVFTFQFLAY